jgi:kynurenine formamidase
MKLTKMAAAFLASAVLGTLSMGSAFAYEKCHKSKWGPNDQIGAINNITSANILAATKLIKQGKAMRMGIETNTKTPAFAPRTYSVTIVRPGQDYEGQSLGNTKTNYHDDILQTWVGIGTQLDGLGHIGIDNTFYNCTPGSEITGISGLKKFGIETVPAVATRAVLLDMTALMGKDIIPEGTAFNQPEIEAALKRQGNMKINKGDIVIFYTGWHKLLGVDDKRNGAAHPGLGVQGARYLASLGVAMIGSDTWGLEVIPFENAGQVFHVHQILLAEFGVFILENVVAEQAIKDKVYEGMITVAPHRTTGSVQAIVSPTFLY